MSEKCLITGGAGFIGSHLIDSLLAAGREVVAIDDLSTGSIENIRYNLDNPNFQFVKDNVRNAQTMSVLIDKCDSVYHLAAAVGVKLIVDKPVHTIETNIHGTEVVLEMANKFGRKIFLASTSEVYGKSEAIPFKEDDDTVLGSTKFSRWSYACSKAIDEFLGLAYHQQYGLEVVIGRFFNTVGPRQTGQYGMVIPRFVEKAIEDEPIEIYGSGKQSRCFGYVGDVVGGVIKLMACDKAAGEVFNIGSDEEITIEDLAKKVIEISGSKSELKHITYQQAYGKSVDDMMKRTPSLDKINKFIGYKPTTNLKNILQAVIKEMRSK